MTRRRKLDTAALVALREAQLDAARSKAVAAGARLESSIEAESRGRRLIEERDGQWTAALSAGWIDNALQGVLSCALLDAVKDGERLSADLRDAQSERDSSVAAWTGWRARRDMAAKLSEQARKKWSARQDERRAAQVEDLWHWRGGS